MVPPPPQNQAEMYARPLHPISVTYRRMHIHPWEMASPQLTIDPCYTFKQEVSHITECTYTHERLTPPANQP